MERGGGRRREGTIVSNEGDIEVEVLWISRLLVSHRSTQWRQPQKGNDKTRVYGYILISKIGARRRPRTPETFNGTVIQKRPSQWIENDRGLAHDNRFMALKHQLLAALPAHICDALSKILSSERRIPVEAANTGFYQKGNRFSLSSPMAIAALLCLHARQDLHSSHLQSKMYQKQPLQAIPVAERLKKREEYFTKDEAIPLMIKSGDIEGLKWLFQKGWPMSYKGITYAYILYNILHLQRREKRAWGRGRWMTMRHARLLCRFPLSSSLLVFLFFIIFYDKII